MATLTGTTDWTDAELAAAVVAYLDMLRCELEGKPFVKASVNEQLRAGPLSSRTKASIEFRMQNISATLYDLKVPFIRGYLPAKNVGTGVKNRIKEVLRTQGIDSFLAFVPTADNTLLDAKVTELRKKKLHLAPIGCADPQQIVSSTTSFVRDPDVKRWVLEAADGHCEGCASPAPFTGSNGFPYLEVHHVVPLSSHGSDRITNAVALCPNCHRRCHFSSDRDEFKLGLYEKIARLKIEVTFADGAGQTIFVA